MPRSEAVACAVVGVLLLGLGACGAPRGTDARAVPVDEVPYALLREDGTDRVDGLVTTAEAAGPQVFLIGADDRLVAQPVVPSSSGTAPVARELLDLLVAGPGEVQRAEGLTTSIGPDVRLVLVEVSSGIASVDIVLAQRDPSADRLPLLVGEIVLTLTSVSGVAGVQLLGDGEPLDAPLPGGARSTGPLTAADYLPLVGPPAP